MFEAVLVAAVVVAALACPVMTLLGRRGIGPGCRMMACTPQQKREESLQELRARERALSDRIATLEAAGDTQPAAGAPASAQTAAP